MQVGGHEVIELLDRQEWLVDVSGAEDLSMVTSLLKSMVTFDTVEINNAETDEGEYSQWLVLMGVRRLEPALA